MIDEIDDLEPERCAECGCLLDDYEPDICEDCYEQFLEEEESEND